MRRGRSTSTPTKEEAAWIVAVKEAGFCVACSVWAEKSRFVLIQPGCGVDYHHTLSGGRRRGHLFGFGLCKWHHVRRISEGCTGAEMADAYGPSLMDGSKKFRETYGTDDELLALQKRIVEGKDDSGD